MKARVCFLVFWLGLLLWLPSAQAATDCNAVTEISKIECQSLLELYNSTDGANWTNNDGWNVTNTPCSWYGVTCKNPTPSTVITIVLEGNNLNGSIPDIQTPFLTELRLSNNQLSDNIPNFSSLGWLTYLGLYDNQLSGSIPDFNLPKLNSLGLSNNQLSGSIPDFSNLPNLTGIGLTGNQLTGNIPNFSNLPDLKYLSLNGNQLSGNVPSFNNSTKLFWIFLQGNQLSSIEDFGSLPILQQLRIDNNQLSGNIPNTFSTLEGLKILLLGNNQLSGPIPDMRNLSVSIASVDSDTGLCRDVSYVYPSGSNNNFDSIPFCENVTLTSPADGATGILLTGQVFDWEDVSGSTQYRIVVSTLEDFSGFTDDGATSSCNATCITAKPVTNTYNGFNLAANTTYYWKVRTNAPGVQGWSEIRSFTTQDEITEAPALSEPANQETAVPLTGHTFTWQAVSGASGYRILISNNADFSGFTDNGTSSTCDSTCTTAQTAETSYTYNGEAFTENTTYYWKVRANSGGSLWSETRSFTTQDSTMTLISPSHNATGVSVSDQNYAWQTVEGAQFYRIVVSTREDFAGFTDLDTNRSCDNTCFTKQITTTSFAGFDLAENTVYYWKVRADTGVEKWSEIRSFTTQQSAQSVALISPEDRTIEIDKETQNFSWQAVDGSTMYRIVVSTQADFSGFNDQGSTSTCDDTCFTDQTADTTFSGFSLAENTTYFWRVRTNAAGVQDWSETWSFTTQQPILQSMMLTNPDDGATEIDTTSQNFAWEAVTGSTVYRIVVSTQANFSGFNDQGSNSTCDDTCFTAQTASTRFSGFNLAEDTTYFWRARTNAPGVPDWSETRTFTTVAPQQAQQFQLTVNQQGQGIGTVTSDPTGIDCGATCIATYATDTVVTLTATPEAGTIFNGWSGACTGTTTCQITMNQAQTVTATFDLENADSFNLTVSKRGQGSGQVTGDGIDCGATCSGNYAVDTQVTLTATPDENNFFNGWEGACSGTGTCQITMNQSQEAIAVFEPIIVTGEMIPLIVSKIGTGSGHVGGDGIDCGETCFQDFVVGSQIALTATPSNDSVFNGWSGLCQTEDATCQATINQPQSAIAIFDLLESTAFTLNVFKTGSGTGQINVDETACNDGCKLDYPADSVVTITANGDNFSGWQGACNGTETCQVTMDQSQTVIATFEGGTDEPVVTEEEPVFPAQGVTLTVNVIGNGKITGSGINCGEDCRENFFAETLVALTAVPDSGATLARWEGDCSGKGTCELLTNRDLQVTAIFKERHNPVASFTATLISPSTVALDGSASSDKDGTIVSYEWSVDGEIIATGISANHTFETTGIHTVTLKVTDDDGGEGISSPQSIRIKDETAPTAQFSVDPNSGSAPLTVELDASDSFDENGNIVRYEWTTSDGQGTIGRTASLTFSDNGIYTVTLTVTDNDGEVDNAQQTVTVAERKAGEPLAKFTTEPSEGEAILTVTLDASESLPGTENGKLTKYQWSSDEGTASGKTASLSFEAEGKHIIELTVTDSKGKTASTQKTILVQARPVADLRLLSAVVEKPVEMIEIGEALLLDGTNSFDRDGKIVYYLWQAENQETGSIEPLAFGPEARVEYTFNAIGVYNISLTVVDDDGLFDSEIVEHELTVVPDGTEINPKATIDATPTMGAPSLKVALNGARSSGKIESYEWQVFKEIEGLFETTRESVTEPVSGESSKFSYTFDKAGNYVVTLKVTDDLKKTGETEQAICVDPLYQKNCLVLEFEIEGLDKAGKARVGERVTVNVNETKTGLRDEEVDLWFFITAPTDVKDKNYTVCRVPSENMFEVCVDEQGEYHPDNQQAFKKRIQPVDASHGVINMEIQCAPEGTYGLTAFYVTKDDSPFDLNKDFNEIRRSIPLKREVELEIPSGRCKSESM